VNSIALAALSAALEDDAYVKWYVGQVQQARSEFLSGLDRAGLKYWPTEANFVLVGIGAAHREFVEAMRAEGILVRDRSADPGCDGCVRITLGTPEQMRLAILGVQKFLKDAAAGVSR
jgi:histidinol-phosphate aminotransferase